MVPNKLNDTVNPASTLGVLPATSPIECARQRKDGGKILKIKNVLLCCRTQPSGDDQAMNYQEKT